MCPLYVSHFIGQFTGLGVLLPYQECDKLIHQNEVSRALIEKLRNENSMLREAKTPIEDLNKYKKDMDELLSRISQLENEKKELEYERDTLSLIIEAKDQEQ